MTELTIGSLVKNPEPSQIKSVGPKQDGTFDDLMQEAVGKISQVQNDAESAVKKLASGGDPALGICLKRSSLWSTSVR